jgi:REP element-mobilizing transposase RayT
MPHSLCQLAVHIIFGLKHHQRYLNDTFHSYINGIIINHQGHPIAINGTEDHLHILCYLPKSLSMSDFVRTIKSNSAKWFNEKGQGRMQWQVGYAAFSVSHTNIDIVKRYIDNQKEHHSKCSFDEEMRRFLAKVGKEDEMEKWFRED